MSSMVFAIPIIARRTWRGLGAWADALLTERVVGGKGLRKGSYRRWQQMERASCLESTAPWCCTPARLPKEQLSIAIKLQSYRLSALQWPDGVVLVSNGLDAHGQKSLIYLLILSEWLENCRDDALLAVRILFFRSEAEIYTAHSIIYHSSIDLVFYDPFMS